MALIQSPIPGRKLQRGLRLTHLPDSVLAPELVGVVLVEDYTAPLSDLSRGCMAGAVQAATVAEFSILVLQRVSSQYDCTVTRLYFASPTAQIIRVRAPSVLVVGLTGVAAAFRDFNNVGAPTSLFGRDTQVAIPAGVELIRAHIPADTPTFLDVNIRLGLEADRAGASQIMIAGESANEILSGGFEWTEQEPEG